MAPNHLALLRNLLTLLGFLAILSLLAAGQLAAVFLLMLPMAFLIFGRRQDKAKGDARKDLYQSPPR